MYPGPTIEAVQGDRILVNVTNNMSNATTIHWHGIYQRGTNYYDGTRGVTQCGIPPGHSMLYNFTLDDWVGTTWWHSHYDTQYSDGLYGAIVVHAANESVPAYDAELVLALADWYHALSGAVLNAYFTPGGLAGVPGNEPVPDGGTINGVGQSPVGANDTFWNVTLAANKTYRLRLINAGSFVALRFSVDAHVLTVVEADGTAVTPYQVDALSIAVAQRYSVLLTTNQSASEGGGGTGAVGGAFWMRAALDTTAFTYYNPVTQDEVRAVLRYGAGVAADALPDVRALGAPPALPAGSPGDMNETALVPVAAGGVGDPTFNTYFTISMQYSGGADYMSEFLAFVNSTSWTPYAATATLFQATGSSDADASATYNGSQLVTTVSDAHTVQVVVDNLDDGDHPFHLHGYKFWILAAGAGRYQAGAALDTQTPMLRDTYVIPAYSYTVLRFVADNPGFWAFHCHIAWHMAAGLLYQFNVLPAESAAFAVPQYMYDQCAGR